MSRSYDSVPIAALVLVIFCTHLLITLARFCQEGIHFYFMPRKKGRISVS